MDEEKIRQIIREELRANNAIIEEKIYYFTNLLPFASYMGDGTVLTKSYFNVMYLVDSNDSLVAPYLMKNGVFETELTKYLLTNIKADSVFVDIGANFGYYTCLAGRKTTNGKVFAFEISEKAHHLLQRNILINWIECPVKIEKIAVSDKKGEIEFRNYKYRFVMVQHTGESETEDAAAAKDTSVMNEYDISTMPTISLDEYFENGQHIDFLKIDVEGMEWSVLQGAQRTIDTNPDIQILMEWSLPQLADQKTDPAIIVDFFKSRGFKPAQLDWRDGSAQEMSWETLLNTRFLCAVRFQR